MAITPDKPTLDQHPWEPTADPSDSDYSIEQAAIADYQAVYGAGDGPTPDSGGGGAIDYFDPTLQMDYTTAPDFKPVGQKPTTTTSSEGTPGPAFSIDLAELRATENTVLSATSTMVDAYNAMHDRVNAALYSTSLWGQNVGTTEKFVQTPTSDPHHILQDGFGGDGPETIVVGNEFDQAAAAYGQAFDKAMQAVLQETAQAIELIGTFTALLNNAGQAYAQIDYSSAFTVPPSEPTF